MPGDPTATVVALVGVICVFAVLTASTCWATAHGVLPETGRHWPHRPVPCTTLPLFALVISWAAFQTAGVVVILMSASATPMYVWVAPVCACGAQVLRLGAIAAIAYNRLRVFKGCMVGVWVASAGAMGVVPLVGQQVGWSQPDVCAAVACVVVATALMLADAVGAIDVLAPNLMHPVERANACESTPLMSAADALYAPNLRPMHPSQNATFDERGNGAAAGYVGLHGSVV
jgi:hypothetical protein